ncbi:putative monooxygenase YcnE [anaerobic digester metagenome]
MITIVASGSIQPDRAAELRKLALDLVAGSRNEEGNVSYDFYEDLADPAKFTFIEVWKDQAAIDSHHATPHFQGFVEKAGQLFAGPLSIGLYRRLS